MKLSEWNSVLDRAKEISEQLGGVKMAINEISEMAKVEFIRIICGLDGNGLMTLYGYMSRHFNPLDFELCDKFELLKNHIISRIDEV